ncbi:hypothetical protein SAMN02745193_01848 [Erythrobacter sanguineus]|uniref:Uncharacterized protein n=1 Tax=Erythrobacter sanguineus TaxID=198312 RepID=A0A1M7SJV7_9SPHN|nr:hypothetical protein SAMN02745193_01848 [Erythrobacter sanguineus]
MAAYGPGNKWRVAIQTRSLPVVELNVGFCQQPLFRFRDRATTALMTGIGWIPEWRQRSFLGSACVVKRRRRSLLYLRHIKAPIGRRAARQLIHRKPDRSLDAGSGLRLIVRVETVPGADQRVERIAHAHRIGPRRQITRDLDIYQRVIFAMQDEERNLARFKVTDAEKLAPPSVSPVSTNGTDLRL